MITEPLRLLFAKGRRPLILGHLALALALVPIPMIRTGMAEAGAFMALFSFQAPPWIGLGILAAGVLFSLPLVPLFLAWSLPGAASPGLPRRSIGLLCLLVAAHPLRFHFEGVYHRIGIRAEAASLSEKYPVVWLIKHLDSPLLLGLVVWAILQHQTMGAQGKLWFQWALFVCVLCAAFAPFDTQFGFLFMPLFE